MSITLFLWGLFGNIRNDFISAANQDKWRLPALFPEVSWYWLVIAFLVLTLFAVLEGAYRTHRQAIADFGSDLNLRTTDLTAEPILELPQLRFECVKVSMVDIAININSFEITYTPTDKDLECKAAIVEFRRQTDESSIEWIDILITAELKAPNSEPIFVNQVRCLDSDYIRAKQVGFHRLERRRLAVVLAISANAVSTYEGRYVRHQGFYPDVFGPSYRFIRQFQQLTEACYDVDLRLMGTQDGKVIIDEVFRFELIRGAAFSDIVFRQKEEAALEARQS